MDSETLQSLKITITDPKGVHGMPAGLCAIAILDLDVVMTVETEYGTAYGDRIFKFPTWKVLGLRIRCGEEITLHARGKDAARALKKAQSVLTTPPSLYPDPNDWFGTCAPRSKEEG